MMPYGWVVTDWVIACIYVCPFMIISVQSGNPWGYAELSAIEPRNLHWQTQRPPKSGDQNILFQTGCTLGKSFFLKIFQNIPQIKMPWFHSPKKAILLSAAGWWTGFHPGSDEVYVVSAVTQLIQAEVHFPREWTYFEQDVGCCKLGRWYVGWCDCVCVMHYRYFRYRFFTSIIKYNVMIFVCAPHLLCSFQENSFRSVLNHAFIVKCF